MLKVQDKQCATCIYRTDSPLDLKKLEAQIADPRMPGHFAKFRICHHSDDACCRGFWNRHKDDFDAGQLAQRLNMVQFVKDDKMAVTTYSAKKLLGAFLAQQSGITYTKLTAKTVSFTDLARGSALFVTVHGWTPHASADKIKAFGKEHGFIVEFEFDLDTSAGTR